MPSFDLQPVMISAVEHFSYCPRQCGLIHVESIYDENLLTLRGNRLHERVDQKTDRNERGRLVLRGLPIWSDEHGLIGRADAVEIDEEGDLCPIEYKSGKNTGHRHALYQACAQALCLEEMFARPVTKAAVYYVASREKEFHEIDEFVRARTLAIVREIREMLAEGELPAPAADRRCAKCSLLDACMPFAVQKALSSTSNIFLPMDEVDLP